MTSHRVGPGAGFPLDFAVLTRPRVRSFSCAAPFPGTQPARAGRRGGTPAGPFQPRFFRPRQPLDVSLPLETTAPFRYPFSADRPGNYLTPGSTRSGRHTLLPLLPGALLRPATPVRGPARRLHRLRPPEGRGRALRLRLRRLPPAGGPVPCRLRRWPAAPLFSAPRPGRPPGLRAPAAARPERPAPADSRALHLAAGRRLRTRVAGIFL